MGAATARDHRRPLWERVALRARWEVSRVRRAVRRLLPELPPGAPGDFARELARGQLRDEQSRASAVLFAALDAEDLREVERQIEASPELRGHWASSGDPATRRHLVLTFGVWLQVPAVLEKTGLTGAQPPEDVHAMARGPLAAAGGLYEADLVVDALASAGVELASVGRALDFGCSSGRVLRVLAAAYPQVHWAGCDPNEAAITWARDQIPTAKLFASANEPPLPLAEGSLDLAYAISIWSHFEPQLGLRWLDEMARVIGPGGHLVCTTHGLASVEFYVSRGLRAPEQANEILAALYRRGSWYAYEFGSSGDWGVVNPDWGTAFLSTEWVLTHLPPQWRLLEYAAGRNQENQDVYVLRRT